MPRKRCKNCTHYKPPRNPLPDGEAWPGNGEAWPGSCALASSTQGERDADTLAYAWDAESWRAGLYVHEDFGCVQFASKRSKR